MWFLSRTPRGAGVLLLCAGSAAFGVTLDWDTVAWANGSLSNSYDIDPGYAGNDLTVAVVANGGAPFQQELPAPNPMTPALSPSFQGGLASVERALCIALNLTSNTQSATVNVTFGGQYTSGVMNVSFKLFDIDFSNASGNTYQDLLTNIRGLGLDGTTLVAPTITTSGNNALSGSGINQVVTGTTSTVDTGAGSGNGNVTVSFAGPIRSFTWTYGSGSAFANPTYQHIGMHDLTFTPVPDSAWATAVSCIVAAGLVLGHRAKFRK